jgi:peptidyl-prolyl cis-trans isomerase SurA
MLALLFTALLSAPPVHAELVDKVVAVVNSEVLTLSDVTKEKHALAGKGLVNDLLFQIYNKGRLLKDQKNLLNYLIDEKLLDSEVKKNGMEVTIERVEQEIQKVARENNLTRAQFKEALAQQGVSLAQYQNFVKKGLERKALVDKEVNSRIRISDEDVAAYYLSTKGPGKAQVYEFTLAHIYFSPKNGGTKGAKARAQEVYKKLERGLPFEKMAEQFSEDPNFTNGGVIGTFAATELSPAIRNAVASLKEGEYSAPVETPQGVSVFRVLKKSLISDPELEENRDQIMNILHQKSFARQLRAWLDQKRAEAFIRINE